MNTQNTVDWLIRSQPALLYRETLIDLFSVTERIQFTGKILNGTPGDNTLNIQLSDNKKITYIVRIPDTNYIYGITDVSSKSEPNIRTAYLLHNQLDTPIITMHDEFTLTKGMINNYIDSKSITTTYGRYILNYALFVDPFLNNASTTPIMPYLNDIFKAEKFQHKLATHILSDVITVEEYRNYQNNLFHIGSFTELSVPSFTEKSITINPAIIARRNELFNLHKDNLHDPLVVVKIEDELINMDKEDLKNDPSSGFLLSGKAYAVCRKKMFTTTGMIEAFSNDMSETDFIPNSLSEGWDINNFKTICNEIRRGSYSRGKETAKGGEKTKFIMRVFQNATITMDDCGSKEGLKIRLTSENINNYNDRYIIDGDELVRLNSANFSNYTNKTVTMRSPQFCKAQPSHCYCYTCFGEKFKKLGYKSVGMFVVDIGSVLMLISMKNMHTNVLSSMAISDLDTFII